MDSLTAPAPSGQRARDIMAATMTYTFADLVICKSADGWSLHAPGSTDEQIADGTAPPLADGPWEDDDHTIPAAAYFGALARLRPRPQGQVS